MRNEAMTRPMLPPMLTTPRAVPLEPGENQAEMSFTPGTKTPAPRRPDRNLVRSICQNDWDIPKRMVAEAVPRMLAAITLRGPCLSASMPQGIWPMV